MMRSTWLVAPMLLMTTACGSSEDPAPASSEAPAATEAASESAASQAETASPFADPAVAAAQGATELSPPVNLLHAVPTAVATSSAFEGDHAQVSRLVDDDVETAWSSESGDLEGAWIAFRVPDDAEVTSIEMTAGITRGEGDRELFAGNHRIRRVRVLRGDSVLAEQALDIASREVQTIEVSGGGGVYRIELVELETGGRPAWREACVSSLRVMGRSPGAAAGTHEPELAVGALPGETASPELLTTLIQNLKAHRAVLDQEVADLEDSQPDIQEQRQTSLAGAQDRVLDAWVKLASIRCDLASVVTPYETASRANHAARDATGRAQRAMERAYERERSEESDGRAARAQEVYDRALERWETTSGRRDSTLRAVAGELCEEAQSDEVLAAGVPTID